MNETNLGGMEKQLNIILVGESGVGKTTWINAMHDFFTYSHLEDAAAGADRSEWSPLIPFQFHMTNERYEEVVMRIDGQSSWSNETYVPGQAPCTQTPMTYEFKLGVTGGLLRLIDTPGITDGTTLGDNGDTNFIQLLAHLRSTVQEIHAILIFLKPNEARLTPTLKFLIQQLLLNWPRSVIPNLIFTFTHTRGTLYRPGESLSALSTFLSRFKVPITLNRTTMYCFDNECLQFFGSKKHGTEYSEDHFDMYRSSWNLSRTEAIRLFSHVKNLCPVSLQVISNLVYVRQWMQLVSRPLIEISKNIFTDDLVAYDFCDDAYTKVNHFKQTPLNYWNTVCTSRKCSLRVTTVQSGSQLFTHYKSICHEGCMVGLLFDYLGRTCQSFDWDWVCTKCGCDYLDHTSINFETEVIPLTKEEEESEWTILEGGGGGKGNFTDGREAPKMENEPSSLPNEDPDPYHLKNYSLTELKLQKTQLLRLGGILSNLSKNDSTIPNDIVVAKIRGAIQTERNSKENFSSESRRAWRSLESVLVEYEDLVKSQIGGETLLSSPTSGNGGGRQNVFTILQTFCECPSIGHLIRSLSHQQLKLEQSLTFDQQSKGKAKIVSVAVESGPFLNELNNIVRLYSLAYLN